MFHHHDYLRNIWNLKRIAELINLHAKAFPYDIEITTETEKFQEPEYRKGASRLCSVNVAKTEHKYHLYLFELCMHIS